jgi:hypothetical protein
VPGICLVGTVAALLTVCLDTVSVKYSYCASQGATLVDDRPPEEQISALAPEVRRLMNSKHGEVTTFLLNCAVQLGHKVSSYAMLIGETSLRLRCRWQTATYSTAISGSHTPDRFVTDATCYRSSSDRSYHSRAVQSCNTFSVLINTTTHRADVSASTAPRDSREHIQVQTKQKVWTTLVPKTFMYMRSKAYFRY